MAEQNPKNAVDAGNDELSIEELEAASGGSPDLTPTEDINTNCGGNCNCQPNG